MGRRFDRRRLGILLAKVLAVFLLLTVSPVLVLRWVPPPTTAFMLRARLLEHRKGRSAPLHYHWVAWRRIAPVMRLAVVASEDQRFPFHHGFDVKAIADAVSQAQSGERLRGASTISQQVAKNLFLWPARSFVRKAIEAWFTALLELCWPKRRILEVYLNVAQFGRRIYGVDAAARTFFSKSPQELTEWDAALLAAVLPDPDRMHVAPPSPYVEQRAREIEDQMALLGSGYLRGL
jgi:monofunctional biosynthetic peptidoglycan transglycosylase